MVRKNYAFKEKMALAQNFSDLDKDAKIEPSLLTTLNWMPEF